MDEKDIEKKMREAWNDHAPKQQQHNKESLWNDFAAEAFPKRKRRYKKWLPAIAAVFVIALTVGVFITYTTVQPVKSALTYTIIENPSSEIKVIILPDSSIVELEPDAIIHYNENFTTNRQIKLTGKAFFKVHTDKKHPFKVSCKETTTTVLGTAFTIDGNIGDIVQVNLYEGRVQMNVKNNDNNWILAPGEQFIYRNRSVSVEAFNRFQDFNDIQLGSVLKYITATYGYKIELPEAYLDKKITVRLNKKETIENVVGIMAQMCNLKPTIDEKLKTVTFE